MKTWTRKHLLGIEDLSAAEIDLIFQTADGLQDVSSRQVKKVPALRGVTVVNAFFEPSTRTRISFELAEKRLSADTLNIAGSSSSIVKGESLRDTVKNLEALKADLIVIRHKMAGVPQLVAETVSSSVVNAGDGAHEHPTQALLDAYTILQKHKSLKGLKVLIVGDILHSRVARSSIWLLNAMGAEVAVVGPAPLIPAGLDQLGVRVFYHLNDALPWADVVNVLRIQLERQSKNYFPSLREYTRLYGIDCDRVKLMKKDALIMHPGPVNQGIELTAKVADSQRSLILDQVTNGVAVRMAVLYLLFSREEAL